MTTAGDPECTVTPQPRQGDLGGAACCVTLDTRAGAPPTECSVQKSPGIARNLLVGRLHRLVSQDILEPVPYGSRRTVPSTASATADRA